MAGVVRDVHGRPKGRGSQCDPGEARHDGVVADAYEGTPGSVAQLFVGRPGGGRGPIGISNFDQSSVDLRSTVPPGVCERRFRTFLQTLKTKNHIRPTNGVAAVLAAMLLS